jgi:hypothetical protein
VAATKKAIKEFVEAAHGNLPQMKSMLKADPELLNRPNGKETALGAACQMRRQDLVEYLLFHGAEMGIYAACVLGLTERVASSLDADPTLSYAKAGHAQGKAPLCFAAEQPAVQALLESRGAK